MYNLKKISLTILLSAVMLNININAGIEITGVKKHLYYVTGNSSKFNLFAKFIPVDAGIELKQFAYNLFEEQIEDQEEIAISKAKQAWEQLKQPLIVDEVGVYFHKYNNFPGAFTKFVYKGLGFDGIYKLMNDHDEMSIFLCVVYMYGENQFKVFTVRKHGYFKKIANVEHDKNAPFDAVFIPKGYQQTYTELAQLPDIYNKIYIRALAMNQIIQFIKNQNIEDSVA